MSPGQPAVASLDAADAVLAAGGDCDAFERIYRRHCGRIYSLCLRMAGEQEADELTQEIFIKSWEKMDSFQGRSALGTWLFRLGINVILSHRARAGRNRSRYHDAGEEMLADLPARPAGTDLRMDFDRAIPRLPEGARDVLILHDVEGFKHEEIARMLEINVGTSKSQLHRARMMMRKVLRA